MNYPIKVLQNQIVEHRLAISTLKNNEDECYAGMLFTDEEIKSHEQSIEQLQIAIKKLL